MSVYLDNAASTKLAPEVLKELNSAYKNYANPSSIHSKGEEAKNLLEDAREIIAKKINAEPEEIIFTSGGTESDNLAIRGIAKLKGKGHIITSAFEHHAVLTTCRDLEKEGFELSILPVTNDGFIKLDKLKEAIRKDTILVSVMHANNEIGTIQSIKDIANICKENNITFHTDAVQSLTKTKIDVKEMGIDLASFSAHKIHGPKGIGALFIREGLKIKSQISGGDQEKKTRAGTENLPGAIAFAKAIEISKEEDNKTMLELRNLLIDELLKIPGTKLNGSRENRLCNNVNISFEGVEGEAILSKLDKEGVLVSMGSACTAHDLKPSHVLTALGLSPELSLGSIRFTLSRYSNKEEIEKTITATKKVIEELRNFSKR